MARSRSEIRTVRTRRGARLVQDDVVLSEVLAQPGPTNDIFDLIAATIAMLSRGDKVAMLGFAAGGTIAPLRAMGFAHPVEAVDLSTTGVDLFRELSRPWSFEVRFHHEDAWKWLKRRRSRFDVIIEDLSIATADGVTKPEISYGDLPALIADRLTSDGIVLTNLLPVPGMSWRRLLEKIAAPHRRAQLILLDDYENRLLLAGPGLAPPSESSRMLRRVLSAIGSDLASGFSLRRFEPR
jgi:hypothetical protein